MFTTNAANTVATDPPINPSHVFFGDSLIKGVLPKKKPKKYAATSFIAIRDAGRINLHNEQNGQKLTSDTARNADSIRMLEIQCLKIERNGKFWLGMCQNYNFRRGQKDQKELSLPWNGRK